MKLIETSNSITFTSPGSINVSNFGTGAIQTDGYGNITAGVLSTNKLNLGWFDPRDYGAKFDGLTDDLPALNAMCAAMPITGGTILIPPGCAWISNTWYPDHPVRIIGAGGFGHVLTNQTQGLASSGFTIAPGRTGIGLNEPSMFGGAADCANSIVEYVDIVSQALIPQNCLNGDLGNGIQRYDSTFYSTAYVRVGECFVKSDNSTKTIFFRATSMTASAGRGPTLKLGMTPGSPPTGTPTDPPGWTSMTLGGSSYTDSSGVTWTVESFPAIWNPSTSYVDGYRVLAPDDNRYIFRCLVGGTSAGSPVGQFVGGDNTQGITINAPFTDGYVTWITELCAGIYTATPRVVFRHVFVRRFTGPAFGFIGGSGMWNVGGSFADESSCQDCDADWVGLGIMTQGDDSNDIHVSNFNIVHSGMLYTTVRCIGNPGEPVGGHGISTHSLGPMTVTSMTIQTSSGRPVLKRGDGSLALFGCHAEVAETCLDSTGSGGITSVQSDFQWASISK